MKRLLMCLVLTLGCGAEPVEEADVLEADAELEDGKTDLLPRPDLVFNADKVRLLVDGAWVEVPRGELVRLPCWTTFVRLAFSYRNASGWPARAHENRAAIEGLAPSVTDYGPLARGESRVGFFTLQPGAMPEDEERELTVTLDSRGAVSESNERNNVFSARLLRFCP